MIERERVRAKVVAITLGLTVLTVFVIAAPFVRFAYRAPAAAVGVSTANGLIAGLVAYLVFGRYRRTHSSSDLLLLLALAILAFTSLVFSALPRAITGFQSHSFSLWAPTIGRALGASVLVAAAWAPVRRLERPVRDAVVGGVIAFVSAAVIAALVGALSSGLPVGMELGITSADLGRPQIVGPASLLVIRAVTIGLYVIAIDRFLRRFERTGDELVGWLAIASPFAAFAALHQLLFPTLFPEHLYTADLLRLGFYMVLLIGALQEIHRYWEEAALISVLEERRRIARDLHDGLAQELAFIVSKTTEMDGASGGKSEIGQIGAAADRALGESRRAIAALTRPVDEPLDVGLSQIAEELAERAGTKLELELTSDVRVKPEMKEVLLRIAREAITNATRHAHAGTITVRLSGGPRLRMGIIDDGVGFDPSSAGQDGRSFGLISMRERADALGAELRVNSQRGAGTEVEVVLPSPSRSGS